VTIPWQVGRHRLTRSIRPLGARQRARTARTTPTARVRPSLPGQEEAQVFPWRLVRLLTGCLMAARGQSTNWAQPSATKSRGGEAAAAHIQDTIGARLRSSARKAQRRSASVRNPGDRSACGLRARPLSVERDTRSRRSMALWSRAPLSVSPHSGCLQREGAIHHDHVSVKASCGSRRHRVAGRALGAACGDPRRLPGRHPDGN